MIRPERREQVGIRSGKLRLNARHIPALPETLRRQGHVGAEQRIDQRTRAAQARERGLDGGVIVGKFALQFGADRFHRGRELDPLPWKNELKRRLCLWRAPAYDLSVPQFAQHARHRFGVWRRQRARFVRQGIRSGLKRRGDYVVAAQQDAQPAPSEQTGAYEPGQLSAVHDDIEIVGIHEGRQSPGAGCMQSTSKSQVQGG